MRDLDNRKTAGNYMERLDTHGVSRRDFLAMASAGAAASAFAAAAGLPNVAVASPNGRLAFISAFMSNEYNQILNGAFEAATRALDFSYIGLDSQFDGERQFNQFEQQVTSGTQAGIFDLADGGTIRGVTRLAGQNQVWVANVWDRLPWFTPFEHRTRCSTPCRKSSRRIAR